MKKLRILSLLMVVILAVAMIPMGAFAATSTSKVRYVKTSNGMNLNVRSTRKTHTTENIVATLAYGTKVTVLREYSGWSYIKWGTSSKNRGYVVTSALSKTKPASVSKKTRYIRNDGATYVNLRSSMKSHANNIIVSMKVGSTVTVLETYTGGWAKVTYGSHTGYVQTKYLSTK